MYLWLLVLCFAPSSLHANEQTNIDDTELELVFGSPSAFAPESLVVQAAAVTPPTTELKPVFTLPPGDYDKFDLEFTKRISSTAKDNFLVSPLALKLALAILSEASAGSTKSELDFVLQNDRNETVSRAKYAGVIQSLNAPSSEYLINFGSRICLEETILPSQKFQSIAKQFYNTDLVRTKFSDHVLAANEINTWVNNVTLGKIPVLVNDGDLVGTVMLLLNALYFKGSWVNQFDSVLTANQPFYVTPELKKTVPFMKTVNHFHFVDSRQLEAKIIRLPYLGDKLSMYLVVPNSVIGLDRVFSGLTNIRKEMTYMREKLISLQLPKFEIGFTGVLNEVLKHLGIWRAFEDTALFPGLSRGQHLSQKVSISKVLQKTGLDVNELGTTAYAATSVSLINKFGGTQDFEDVIVNHPFYFFIEDEHSRQILFSGRLNDPTMTVNKL